MDKVKELPACRQNSSDCFAFYEGCCRCLTDTAFASGKCPFYKTSKQNRKEADEARKKNLQKRTEEFLWNGHR